MTEAPAPPSWWLPSTLLTGAIGLFASIDWLSGITQAAALLVALGSLLGGLGALIAQGIALDKYIRHRDRACPFSRDGRCHHDRADAERTGWTDPDHED